jgi:hypothetical protein
MSPIWHIPQARAGGPGMSHVDFWHNFVLDQALDQGLGRVCAKANQEAPAHRVTFFMQKHRALFMLLVHPGGSTLHSAPRTTREEDDRHEPIAVVVETLNKHLPTQITPPACDHHWSNIMNLRWHRPKGWIKNESEHRLPSIFRGVR